MTTQQRGRVITWKDDKGFGFIKPDAGGPDVFFHANSLASRRVRPAEQAIVFYTLAYNHQRRPCATHVYLDREALAPLVIVLVVVSVFFGLLGALALFGMLPAWVVLIYLVMSFLTFATYRSDKLRAGTKARRTPEATLHQLELFGGWPGALVAQQYFHHKSSKQSFQLEFWFMVLLNTVMLGLGVALYVVMFQP